MLPPTLPEEHSRLATLYALDLLDTAPDERFDRITRTAQRLFSVPIALVSLVDRDRQWFKSRIGLEVPETSRAVSFCAHAIASDDIMVVEDATHDPRFVDNALVVGEPGIRFYAGAPIRAGNGSRLGTLCLIGQEPRNFDDDDRRALRDLADLVEEEVDAKAAAVVDELTGLVNRRGFQLLATQAVRHAQRFGDPVSVLFLDVDDMKAVNDAFGHAAGDEVLRLVAAILSKSLRAVDVASRLGGDEFAVLLSATAARETDLVVARIVAELTRHNQSVDESRQLAISIGPATVAGLRVDTEAAGPPRPTAESIVADLLARADEAMYDEKERRKGSAAR